MSQIDDFLSGKPTQSDPQSIDDFLGASSGAQKKKERTAIDVVRDVGVTALKGAVGLPQSFVGLADIPTGGRVGKALEEIGYRPQEAQQMLDEMYSEAQQEANRQVRQAEGFVPTIQAALENPSVIATTVGESLPQMLGGAGVARGLMKAAPAVAPWVAGAVGEGVIGAGGAASQIRGESADRLLTPAQSLAAVGSGVGTALLGAVGGKIAQRAGLPDVDTMLATGKLASPSGFAKAVVGSGITEGVFEELPQSVQEQMWQNYATGKPLTEGVGNAAALGLLSGAAMGMAGGGYSAAMGMRDTAPAPETAVPAPGTTPPAAASDTAQAAQTVAPAQPVEPTEAEKALMEPKSLTALDRVNEIDTEDQRLAARLAELNAPDSGYGQMFDQERQELASQRLALDQERQGITQTWPKAQTGAQTSFTTEAGARVDAQYALIEAADLTTSHDENLRPNATYPQELQPRERDRAASEMQVSGIVQKLDPARLGLSADAATGAPIVGADGLVESGNARTIALKRVYQANGQKAADYKQFLRDNAAQFGITSESVDAMQKPVLVRVRSTPVNRAEFARQANASTVAQMSPSEQAKSDANRIDSMEDLQPDDNGDFSGPASRPFVRRFMAKLPTTEQAGMIDANGNLSTAGYTRVRNAVLARAYGDSPVLLRMVESMDDNLRNVSKALMTAAPKVAQVREAVSQGVRFDADITPDLMAAVEELSRLKDAGTSVQDALAQAGMFGDKYSPETRDLLQFLADNIRKPRRMADFIVAYMDALDAAGDPNQGSLLGDVAGPAKGELMTAARATTERTPNVDQDTQRADAGKDAGAGAQAGGKPADAARGESRAQGDETASTGGVNAIQERGAAALDAQEPPRDGQGVGGRDTQRQEAARAGEGTQQGGKAQGQGAAQGTADLPVAGEGETSEWVMFPRDTGTIGIPRAEMPQVKGEHRGALIQFLGGKDIQHKTVELSATDLKPTQAEFSTKKAERWKAVREGVDRSVLASSDGYVLDGHHQWVAALAMGEPIKVIQFDAPIRDLMAATFQFPSVQRGEGATAVSARAQARQDFKDAMADLAMIATKHTRLMMVPEKTPNLMPTLVRLMEAGIKEVGYSIKDLIAYVKSELKKDPGLKTFWNKIGNDLYLKAAEQAMARESAQRVDDLFAQAEERMGQQDMFGNALAALADEPKVATINGQPYDIKRDNFKAPTVESFMDAGVLARADGYVEKYYKDRPPVQISDADRAKAEQMLAPLLEKAAADKAEYDQKIIDIAGRTKAIGQMLAPIKGIKRAAEKLVEEERFNLGGMKDILRSTIVVNSYADAQQVLDEIEREFELFRAPKNRTNDFTLTSRGVQIAPENKRLKDGYTDVMVNVVMPSGVIAEIQINVPEMLAAKEGQGHKLYEAQREAPKDTALGREIGQSMTEFYQSAFDAAQSRAALAAASKPAGSSEKEMPPRGAPSRPGAMPGRGSSASPSSDSLNQPSPGISTNQSPPSVGTNSQPAGNLSGTLISSPRTDIVPELPVNGYTTGDLFGAQDANVQPGAGGTQEQGPGAAQEPGGQRQAARVRAGSGRADQQPGGVADAGAAGQAGVGQAGAAGVRGADENGRLAQPGTGARADAGIPAGRDIPPKSGRNYAFGPDDLTYEGNWRKKAEQNVQAIELLKKLETEGRQATRDEQSVLAKFIGWGASEIANNLFGKKLDKAVEAMRDYSEAIKQMDALGRDYLQKGGQYRGQYADNGYYAASSVLRAAGKIGVHEYPLKVTRADLEAAKPDASTRRWIDLRDRMKAAMTEQELAEASRSTQYAHYTSKEVVRSMWSAMERMGFKGGSVLEPGAGIGVFPGLMPQAMAANSIYTGIEYDSITGRILKQLFPDERILVESFVDSKLPKNFYDVAAGNPPFSGTKILSDPEYAKRALSLHDYFFAKSIDRVKPGGLVMYVTSRYTMDKLDDKARKYLAERADLVGAIRLPQTAFKQNAGTEVVTDVIFLRKKVQGETFEQAQPWLGVAEVKSADGKTLMVSDGKGEKPAMINEYFVAHPEMVLGQHANTGSMYADKEYTVTPLEGDIEALFDKAVNNLPEGIYQAERGSSAEAAKVREIDFNPKAKKEGNYYVSDSGALMVREGGVGQRVELKSQKDVQLIKDFVPLRDALKQAHYDQLNDGEWQTSLASLQKAYADFAKKHGQVNQFTTKVVKTKATDEDTGETYTDETTVRVFPLLDKLRDDPDYTLVAALETVNDDTGEIKPSAFLTDRVLGKPEAAAADTPMDAMLSVLNDVGHVDIPLIGQRVGLSEADTIEALGSAIYHDPAAGWVTADEYLSGNVKRKLDEAREAAKGDKRFDRNVQALEAHQPAPKTPSQINVAIGMNWVPGEVYGQFLRDIAGVNAEVQWNERTKQWIVQEKSGGKTMQATADWGTAERNVTDLMETALTGRQIRVTKSEGTGKDKKTVFDAAATEAANQKLTALRERFSSWVWEDAARTDRLVKLYNDTFNTTVPRSFDGRHLTLPGTSKTFSVFDHVKRGAWRIIQRGNTYLAHAVGSGKTFQMVISAMEQKRLGLIKKPMVVVPNHMLKQFAHEWQQLYPAARLMVADENNFHTDNRRRFVSRVALSDLDGVIITHSAFKLLDLDPDFKRKMIEEQLEYMRAALEEAGGKPDEKGKSRDPKIKQIEKQIENFEQKLEASMSSEGKDKNVRFDELGVDFLYVDEAHEFRKLDFTTNRKVKNINPEGSARAFDLFMKARYLEEKTPGRSLVMASGTPVTNTLAELYTVQKFMDRQALEDRGIEDFDSWASMFGRERTVLEPNAAGKYEPVTRFSKFVNVSELTQMFREFADVLTADHLAALLGDKRPKVDGGSRQIIVTPKTDDYAAFQQVLSDRVEKSRNWKPSREEPNNPDPIIKIIGDGRLAAIDMRFMDPSLPSDPDSKLNRMIDDVIKAMKDSDGMEYRDKAGNVEPNKGASMMVFSDLGFGAGVAATRGFNARAWFEKRLRDEGISMNQVAFMSDYKKSADKLKLFKDVNAGRVRLLVGSSKNMGTGVNAQQRLLHLFHLDSPWYPADLEQREGRIVRQGNKNPLVNIHAYAAKGTYDENMWKMLASKQFFIDQALSGDENLRELEDLDSQSQYDLAAAMVAEDPRILQLAGVRAEIEKLQRLYQAHEDQRARFKSQHDMARATVEFNEKRMPEAEADAKKVQDLAGDKFKAKAAGKTFTERAEWAEALIVKYKDLTARGETKPQTIGEISGFPVVFGGESVAGQFMTKVVLATPDPLALITDPGTSPIGVAMRAQNAVFDLARLPAKLRERITEARAQIDALSTRLETPFPMSQMLADKVKEASDLEAQIAIDSMAKEEPKDDKPAEDTRLARGGAGGGAGMDTGVLQALAKRIKAKLPNMPKVHVLATPADAPQALKEYILEQDAWGDVEGAMHDGELYLFASGLSDELRVEHVLAEHEAAHFGLRGILGTSMNGVMNFIYANNPNVRKAATMLQQRGKLSNSEAVEEAIVDMPTSELVKLKGWRRVVLATRDWLANHGFTRMAERLTAWLDGTLTDQQRADLFVAELVQGAREYVAGKRTGQAADYAGVTRLSTLAEDIAKQEKWLSAEAKARGYKDIEDLAERNYSLFEKLAALWREKNPAEGGVMLSRAPVQKATSDRAQDIIDTKAGSRAPLDTLAKGLTRITGIERMTGAIYDRAAYLLDRYTPEQIKAGVVSDYGVPESVIDQRAMMQGRQRVQLRKAGELIEKLSTLTRAESRIAYEWMNETDPEAVQAMIDQLPPESVKVLQDVQKMIDKLSLEAVRMGQLSPEAYERNKFAYLHRSYAKHVLEQTGGEKAKRARVISILGDQYKGRGLTEAAPMSKVQNVAPDWWKRKLARGKADAGLKGEKFIRLERHAPSGEGVSPLPGMEGKDTGRLLEVVYWPADETIPSKYSEWSQAGTFEVRDVKGENVIFWRDFTKDERQKMGEIDEARFAIAKTLHGMIHDVEVGRYLEWLAHTQALKEGQTIPGVVVEASERYRDTFAPGEWVKVPDTKIPGTSVAKYGKLAGRYLPGPVWNDLRQVVNGQFKPFGDTYSKILSMWKTAKTALSPAVHTNNVMSNFVMADWHDVGAAHVAKALRIILASSQRDGKGLIGRTGNLVARAGIADREAALEILNRYKDSGGDIGSWATQEIAQGQLEPLLADLEKELAATNGQSQQAQVGVMSALQHALMLRFPSAFDALKASKPGKAVGTEAKNLIDLYQNEDDIFRLAAWLKAKEDGKTDLEAGRTSRKSFLDYSINAPWIQAMRQSAWPFIGFTYRAVPMFLEIAGKKPHKLLKLMALAGALNALGVMMAGGGDDDEDKLRKLLPEEKAGKVWGLVPKLIRMPWNDAQGSPVYLDIRRFIPVGDVFDVGQGHSAIPILPGFQPGGPLALAAEVVANRSMFTGKPITLDTDTPLQKAEKLADYLYKAFAPNVLGVPGTYATTAVSEAAQGKTDAFGRQQSVAQAVASSFGVKLGSYPADVLRLNLNRKAQSELMEIDRNITQLKRQRMMNRIDQADFEEGVRVEQNKQRKVMEELRAKVGG